MEYFSLGACVKFRGAWCSNVVGCEACDRILGVGVLLGVLVWEHSSVEHGVRLWVVELV